MQEYRITLLNEKLVLYNRFSILTIIILTLLYSYLGFFTANPASDFLKVSTLIFMAVLVLLKTYSRKRNDRTLILVLFLLLAVGFGWLKFYWFAAISLVFEFFFLFATKEKIVDVSSSIIKYPSFPVKKLNWTDLNNLILKDGLLTIDLKNNKIIQQMIDADKTRVAEKDFNEFCRVNLRNRRNDNSKPDYGGAVEGLGEIVSSL